MLCHLTALSACVGIPFGNIIGPLIIWQIKKDEVPETVAHAKESINFQITAMLVLLFLLGVAGFALMLIAFWITAIIGIPLLLLVVFVVSVATLIWFIFVVVATIKANEGEFYRYPMTLRLLR